MYVEKDSLEKINIMDLSMNDVEAIRQALFDYLDKYNMSGGRYMPGFKQVLTTLDFKLYKTLNQAKVQEINDPRMKHFTKIE